MYQTGKDAKTFAELCHATVSGSSRAWGSAAGSIGKLTVIGAVLLTLLFIGSTRFTEEITPAEYSEWAQYQASTSAVVPWPQRGRTSTTTTLG